MGTFSLQQYNHTAREAGFLFLIYVKNTMIGIYGNIVSDMVSFFYGNLN